jgi:hypothetical protein
LTGPYSRLNDFCNVLSAIGEHKGEFGDGRQSCRARVEKNGADTFANGAASGFAGGEHIEAASAQALFQMGELRRFATPIEPFKRYENPAPSAHG